MLIDQIRILTAKGGDKIESLIYKIQHYASMGRKWILAVNDEDIINYFKSEGFKISFLELRDPELIVISWEDN